MYIYWNPAFVAPLETATDLSDQNLTQGTFKSKAVLAQNYNRHRKNLFVSVQSQSVLQCYCREVHQTKSIITKLFYNRL